MNMKAIKYLAVFTGPILGVVAFLGNGIWTWSLVIWAFGILNILDLALPASPLNMSKAEEQVVKQDKLYDWLLYLLVPTQYVLLILFLFAMGEADLNGWERAGRVITMGISCAILGINVAHELGHRHTKHEKFLSKALLLTSLYTHFFIEHNRGHHKNVSTPEDPASARKGEWLYTFFVRSVVFGWISAWKIENKRVRKTGKPVVSFENEMVRFSLLQAVLLGVVALLFSWQIMLWFVLAATIGFLLLETVNYVEHYGLARKKVGPEQYERVLPIHSWNSNHPIGRIMLFELTRHSDHHAHSGRKYQVLRSFEDAPQLPGGYPAMVLLALVPPLWFAVMHRHIDKLKAIHPEGSALA